MHLLDSTYTLFQMAMIDVLEMCLLKISASTTKSSLSGSKQTYYFMGDSLISFTRELRILATSRLSTSIYSVVKSISISPSGVAA